jgi:hypothetical protein
MTMNEMAAVTAFQGRRTSPSVRTTLRVCGLLLALAVGACGDPKRTPTVGSNSNWLQACSADHECGAPTACRCGACTSDCSSDGDCARLADARCALVTDPATWAACQSTQPALTQGICLPRCEPGSCDEGRACVAGACVLAAMPSTDFCAPVSNPGEANRSSEEELLELLQQMRAAGGVTCGADPPSAQLAPLRLDTRLLCAARVFAADLEVTRVESLVDSRGRGSQERLALAGYDFTAWGESFVFDAPSATEALSRMLADADSCSGLTDAVLQDVGVGASGHAYVVTLGAE